MKARNGFISNSSSSSFVVPRFEDTMGKRKKLLLKNDEIKLKKFGFSLGLNFYPDQVRLSSDDEKLNPELDREILKSANWCQYVSCNQDETIEFLLKNRISFTADIYYGHYSMIYDGKTDVLIIAQNFGKQIQMCGTDKMTFASIKETNPVERTTGKEYIKTLKI